MNYNDLVKDAEEALAAEDREVAIAQVKERIREIRVARKTLSRLEREMEEFLSKPVEGASDGI